MGKIKAEICEICKKQDCSGKIFWAYDKGKRNIKKVCEDQTVYNIRRDILIDAGKMYIKDHPNNVLRSYSIVRKKYLISACEKKELNKLPIIRYFKIKDANGDYYNITMEEILETENAFAKAEKLYVPFTQLKEKSDDNYSTYCNRLEDIGQF